MFLLALLGLPFAYLVVVVTLAIRNDPRGLGQTILVVPREADVPPGLMALDRLEIRSGAVRPWLPKGIAKLVAQEPRV